MRVKNLRERINRKSTTVGKMSIIVNDEKPSFRLLTKKSVASFLEGYGSILNIGGGTPAMSGYFAESDGERLHGDWVRIGKDMRIAINNFEHLYGKKKVRKSTASRSKGFSAF